MLLEIHAHTNRHSKCSILDPVTLVRKIVKKGLQGLIITEHHYLWSDEELARLREEAGVEKWFVLLAGQEVETDIGHVLVYGARASITKKTGLKTLRKLFPEAALVWAHPFRNGETPSRAVLASPLLDGIEIFSLNHSAKENYAGLKSWHELKFTALSGSDAHSEGNAGVLPTQFDHAAKSIGDAAAEIRGGRVRPFFKEIPKSGSDLTVTEITMGTKGDDELRQRIIVKTLSNEKKWEKTKQSAELLRSIYNNGFSGPVFRVPKVIDINENEKTLIEEGQRGKNLYDSLLSVGTASGRTYFEYAAQWIAKFHSLKLRHKSAEGIPAGEKKKFLSYAKNLRNTGNSRLIPALKLIEYVEKAEEELYRSKSGSFVLNHGDYHPKNIIIGHERMNDPETLYISVIDFASSSDFPPAFDVGYFLAQFAAQFSDHPDILERYDERSFLNAYSSGPKGVTDGFLKEVNIFKIRANLSIANYLIRVGKGESPELYKLIEKSSSLMKDLS